MKYPVIAFFSAISLLLASTAQAQTLRGSQASIDHQNRLAVAYGYTFVETAQSITQLVNSGQLVRVSPTRYLDLHDVSYPFARSGVKLFVNRLSAQYYNACGEKLTVTSLSRPQNQQPANAAARSVHPAGMAVDLRVPQARQCRSWLERTLLSLEERGVLDVTRERRPPHYHVAVFVESYETYVASMTIGGTSQYVVRSGDTLSRIADLTGVSIAQLRAANNLSSDLIRVGQELQIPESPNGSATISSGRQIAAVTQVTHKVRKGETLWRIGNRYGTSVARIMMENELDDDLLRVGQELRISATR